MNVYERYEKVRQYFYALQKTNGNLNTLPSDEYDIVMRIQDDLLDDYYSYLSVYRDGYSCDCKNIDTWECTCEDCYGFCDDDFYEYCCDEEPYYAKNIDDRVLESGIEEIYNNEYHEFVSEFNEYMKEHEVYDE